MPAAGDKGSAGASLPDLLGPDVRLLFVGINPGLTAVATQIPFAGPGNRFFRALHLAGIIDHAIEASAGIDHAHIERLLARGIGITSLVARATASADKLEIAELVSGATSLGRLVTQTRPRVVAMLGITAYRLAFQERSARVGRQPPDLAGAQLWVVPNPSGRNVRASLTNLATAYREVAVAAGLAVSLCRSR